jgi:hypothetical protein
MKIFRENEKSKALCPQCGAVSVTYRLRTVPFSDGSGVVKDILAGVCDECNQVAVIPQQSALRIREVRQSCRQPLEVRLPVHLLDMLYVAADTFGGNTLLDAERLLKLYVHYLVARRNEAKALSKLLNSELAKGRASARLSLRVSPIFEAEFDVLKHLAKLRTKTQLIKALALKCHEDTMVKPNNVAKREIGRLFHAMRLAA